LKQLERTQWLPISLDEAWDFFSSPKNLNEITPPEMVFEIQSKVPTKMYEGLFITYCIKPMFNIPLKWVTEITHVNDRTFFVDEQRVGPYKIMIKLY
jgi:ligand-binding SRPBCC domain-containing protein